MGPKVSIVMPVYNCKAYLHEALESIIHQTYRDFEVICVDDGSTDGSVEILNEYANKDERFIILQQRNQYAGVARNNGMKAATGKYLMFLDSDDVFEKNMLSFLVKKAEQEKTDIIYFGFYEFKDNIKKRSLMGIPYHSKKVFAPTDHAKDIFHIAQGVPWNKIYNRDFVINTGIQFQNLKNDNDQLFVRTIVLEAQRLLFLNKRFVNYRINNQASLSYRVISENLIKSTTAIYDSLRDHGRYEIYRNSFEDYVIERYLGNFPKCRDFMDFERLCEAMRLSFNTMQITEETPAITNHPARELWKSILRGNIEEGLYQLCVYMWGNYCPQKATEYRIGKKLLSMFKVKNYE